MVYLTAAMGAEQQGIADSFFRQNLIPKQILVKDIFWQPATVTAGSCWEQACSEPSSVNIGRPSYRCSP